MVYASTPVRTETPQEESKGTAAKTRWSTRDAVRPLQSVLGSTSAAAIALAEEARGYTDELGQEIRTTSYLLHPPMLDETDLPAAMAWYVDGVKGRSGFRFTVTRITVKSIPAPTH
jgi:signal transduction histidine kinase